MTIKVAELLVEVNVQTQKAQNALKGFEQSLYELGGGTKGMGIGG